MTESQPNCNTSRHHTPLICFYVIWRICPDSGETIYFSRDPRWPLNREKGGPFWTTEPCDALRWYETEKESLIEEHDFCLQKYSDSKIFWVSCLGQEVTRHETNSTQISLSFESKRDVK